MAGADAGATMHGTQQQKQLIDQQLMHDMEELFSDQDGTLLAAVEVMKIRQAGDATGSQLLRALGAKNFLAGREAPKPRVLAFSVKRSRGGDGFRASLHVVKRQQVIDGLPTSPGYAGGYKVTRTYPLRALQELRAPPGRFEYGGTSLKVVELVWSLTSGSTASLSGVAATGVGADPGRGEYGVRDESQALLLAALIMTLLRQSSYQVPKLQGLEVGEVDRWWVSHKVQVVRGLGDFSAEVLTPGEVEGAAGAAGAGSAAGGTSGGAGGGTSGSSVLVSAKEERDFEELLDLFAMGIGDLGEFEARLRDEFEALEAANVHTILSNGPLVDSVVFQLRKTSSMLEDMDETLTVFDAKLRTMREDIGAIEAHNNSLERAARNNGRLLETLQGLLADLKLPSDVVGTLESPPLDKEKLGGVTRAAWTLHQKLQLLSPDSPQCISRHLLKMRVVRDARANMESLASHFVSRALAHLAAEYNRVVDSLVQASSAKSADKSSRTTSAPDHSRLASLRKRTAELVRVVGALDPSALPRLQEVYAQTVNMLLRKELRAASSDLRKAVQLDSQNNPIDYGLTKESASMRNAVGVAGSMMSGSDEASVYSDMSSLPGRGPGSVRSSRTGGTVSSMRLVARARGGTFDGSSLAMPLNEAYTALLDAWLPLLVEEVEAAAGYMQLLAGGAGAEGDAGPLGAPQPSLRRSASRAVSAGGGKSGGGAGSRRTTQERRQEPPGAAPDTGPQLSSEAREFLGALVAGLDTEFYVLVELTVKGHQVMCLPMMAATTRWLTGIISNSTARDLARVLASCHERLRTNLHAFISNQLSALDQYASKGQGGVKALHVLAFTAQFALLSHHLEMLLAGSGQQQGGGAGVGGGEVVGSPAALRVASAARSRGGAAGAADDGGDGELERILVAASWRVRLEVDEMYQSMVGQMFTVLERMAGMDAKHGNRLRLENYAYFVESVRPLLKHVTVLEPFMAQADSRQEEAMRTYVQQQLEYGKLWKLLEFSEKLDKLLEVVVSPHEVSFQAGCSAPEVAALINSTMKDADKKLDILWARVKKHLGTSTLAYRVWERIQEQLLIRYERLEVQVEQCYPEGSTGGVTVTLSPSPEELAQVLHHSGPGQE